MREVIMTGKTVEEATEKACQELGKNRDEVSVEILEMPVKKLFKTIPAKVRVSVDGEEDDVVAAPVQKAAAPAPEAPRASEKAPAAAVQKTPEKPPENTQKMKAVLAPEPEVVVDPETDPAAKRAVEYLTTIFHAMGVEEVEVQVVRQGEATLLRVDGEQISDKVDTRGETVQALSYLTDRTVNRGVDKKDDQYMRIRLDVAGYRNRREGELIALAERTGQEVAQSKRSRTLAPMNPYERLIIHTKISEMEGVTSESTGSDTERRVVIRSTAPDAVEGEDWKPACKGGDRRGSRDGRDRDRRGGRSGGDRGGRSGDRDRGSRGGDGGGRGGYDRGPRQPRTNTPEREYAGQDRDTSAGPVVPTRRDAVKDGEDLPLYGKIEL